MRALVAILLVTGCASSANKGSGDSDASASSDAPPMGCSVFLTFDPTQPEAGDQVRATANIDNLFGVPAYQWNVTRASDGAAIAFTDAQPDHSAVSFPADLAGVYTVQLQVTGGATFCPTAQADLNVFAPGGNVVGYRLRVATQAAPPQEQSLQVHGGVGGYAFGSFVLSPGVTAMGRVMNGSAPVAAYLRFIPSGHPDEVVEAFSGTDGRFTAQLVDEMHQVLVVPAVAGSVPAMRSWQTGQTTLAVDAGNAISGVVKDPSGAVIAGATVQVTINGVPSTIADTTGTGAFTVRGEPATGSVTVEVTPPAASGLPRLTATGAFDPTQSIQVRYASNVIVRNLAGTVVQRGAGLPGATVTIVGSLAGIGTVTTGTTSAAAVGAVRVTATTNASGVLPALLAPNGPLSAVIERVPGDLSVVAIDLSTAVPATITAPAPLHPSGITTIASGPLGGATIEAAPLGALALADAVSVLATSVGDGSFTLQLAAGGDYQLRLSHQTGLAGPAVIADVTGANLPSTLLLPPPVAITGSVAITGNPSPIAGAAVQILCKSCVGIERSRPIAGAASDASGGFQITVADPGTM